MQVKIFFCGRCGARVSLNTSRCPICHVTLVGIKHVADPDEPGLVLTLKMKLALALGLGLYVLAGGALGVWSGTGSTPPLSALGGVVMLTVAVIGVVGMIDEPIFKP